MMIFRARQSTLETFLVRKPDDIEKELEVREAQEEPFEIESAPELQEKTDEELKAILGTLNTSEAYGLRFGLFPASKISPGTLSNQEAARLMKMAGAE